MSQSYQNPPANIDGWNDCPESITKLGSKQRPKSRRPHHLSHIDHLNNTSSANPAATPYQMPTPSPSQPPSKSPTPSFNLPPSRTVSTPSLPPK